MLEDPLVTALGGRNRNLPGLAKRLLKMLLGLILALVAADLILLEMNRRLLVLPQFDLELLPYHDPRVTRRNALVKAYPTPPKVIFTGDSRTKNGIVPEVVARTLGVPHQTLFNFGTGSQVARFAREAFLPHLLDIEVRPEFLVFGVSPDWPLQKRRLWKLIDRYRESPAYRLEHAPASGGDAVEGFISRFLSYRLSLFRYRRDLIEQELLPDLRCWFLDDCYLDAGNPRITPAHFKDLERRSGFKTACGWGPQPYDGHTTGEFFGRARFDEGTLLDEENLLGLFEACRSQGITPLLLIMPVHDSFRRVHDPVMSRNQARLEDLAAREKVDILRARGDYRDRGLFVDGHHLSHRGAVYFSADLARALSPQLTGSRRVRSRRPASTEDLVKWIYDLNPEIETLWGRSVDEVLAVRGESRASTETVPAPAGPGATEGAYREYVSR